MENFDSGYTACFETHTAEADLAPSLACPAAAAGSSRWGYVVQGRVGVRLDGGEETHTAGDACYVPAGHTRALRQRAAHRVQPDRTARPCIGCRHGEPARQQRLSTNPSSGKEKIVSVFYQLAYRIGFHPWEDLADHAPFAGKLAELLDREECGRGAPFGRALDVGTGSGIWAVRLARRGWQVTAIDNVEPALRRARMRAAQEGVDMQIVRADITTATEADIGSGLQLVLDTGTFHGLNPAERAAMARVVDVLTTPDATVLLDVFAPGRRGPLPRGATRADVEAAFPGWKITHVEVADTEPEPIAQRLKFDEHWYRLRRE